MQATASDGISGNDYNNSGGSGCDGHCLVLWWEVVVMLGLLGEMEELYLFSWLEVISFIVLKIDVKVFRN